MVLLWILLGIFVLWVVKTILVELITYKCRACGKLGALVEKSEREISREPIWKTEQKTVKDRTGKAIGTIDEDVLYDHITKKVKFACKYCGYEEEREVTEDKKSTRRY